MRDIWNRIEQWLDEKAPRLLTQLKLGATEAEIHRLESSLNAALPSVFRESLKIHNGQIDGYLLTAPWRLIPLAVIADESQKMAEIFQNIDDEDNNLESRGPVKPVVWNTAWVPFAIDGTGNMLCIDGDPDLGGQDGQVILWAADPPYVEVIASDFRTWLGRFADKLVAGELRWEGVSEADKHP